MKRLAPTESRLIAELHEGPGSPSELANSLGSKVCDVEEMLYELLERGDVKRVPYKWITPSGLTVERTGYIYMIPEHAEAWDRGRKA